MYNYAPCSFSIKEQELILLPEKAIYWKDKEILILSDLHLGKANHFRKSGIPVPRDVHQSDYDRLAILVDSFSPKEIVFLGDLFHSNFNSDWQIFSDWCNTKPDILLHLVKGNHDILPAALYSDCSIQIHEEVMFKSPFVFSHEPLDDPERWEPYYTLSGHLHPGVKMAGAGRQKIVLPCFYFKENQGILPAFGNFTGCTTLKTSTKDKVFLVTDERVILV